MKPRCHAHTKNTTENQLKDKTKEAFFVTVKRGEIYYADLSPVVGSEQGGVRPVLIVQNDMGNRYSPTVIAAAITSQRDKAKLPTHIELQANSCGLPKDSIILLEQVRTIDKKRLKEKMGEIPPDAMNEVNSALSVSFGLIDRSKVNGLT
jgi:mRNA interferase MazF